MHPRSPSMRPQLSTRLVVRLIRGFIICVILGSLAWVGMFLWREFYLPLTQASTVAELKTEVTLAAVRSKQLQVIIDAMEVAKARLPINPTAIRDPFVQAPVTPPVAPPPPPAAPPSASPQLPSSE